MKENCEKKSVNYCLDVIKRRKKKIKQLIVFILKNTYNYHT